MPEVFLAKEDVLVKRLAWLQIVHRQWDDAVSLLAPHAAQDSQLATWLGLARERLAPGSSKQIWESLIKDAGLTAEERARQRDDRARPRRDQS